MGRYVLRRLLAVGPVLLGVAVLTFSIMALVPGDPAQAILGSYATPENVERLNQEWGLERPLPVQFVTWLGNVARGDLGRSYALDRPVRDEVLDRLGPTLLLAGTALLLSTLAGILVGTLAAVRQGGWPDRILTLVVLVGISTPTFWLAILLVIVFALHLQWFPVSGMYTIWAPGGAGDLLRHLALPALSLAAVATAVIARLTRAGMLEVLRQDHLAVARARGLPEHRVVLRHALRNTLASILPIVGLQAGFVLGGAVYVETVFEWPGVGRMLVEAIAERDLMLVQGGVLVIAGAYVLINLATDLVQYALDPRIDVR